MHEIGLLGVILLMALLVGHLAKALCIPEVTGYIVAGIALGPSYFNWVGSANLDVLHAMSQVALGMILFSVGSGLDLSHFRSMGRRILIVSGIEAAVTGTLVTATMLALGVPWQPALLLGCISMSTAPAATMMVVREHASRGPLTDTIVGVVAANKVVVLVAFSLVATAISLAGGLATQQSALSIVGQSTYWLIWELAGSTALGFLVGLLLATWGSALTEHGEAQILLAGCVLFCIGSSIALGLSPLISSMAVGATVVNLSETSQRLAMALSRFDPPIYAMFFVIAGAGIEVGQFWSLGMVGAAFIAMRAIGKAGGFWFGCRRLQFPEGVGLFMGVAMLALADLAIGLTIEIARRFPELRDSVSPIVLGAVAFYETMGPMGTRLAILRSGEANRNALSSESAEEPADSRFSPGPTVLRGVPGAPLA